MVCGTSVLASAALKEAAHYSKPSRCCQGEESSWPPERNPHFLAATCTGFGVAAINLVADRYELTGPKLPLDNCIFSIGMQQPRQHLHLRIAKTKRWLHRLTEAQMPCGTTCRPTCICRGCYSFVTLPCTKPKLAECQQITDVLALALSNDSHVTDAAYKIWRLKCARRL